MEHLELRVHKDLKDPKVMELLELAEHQVLMEYKVKLELVELQEHQV